MRERVGERTECKRKGRESWFVTYGVYGGGRVYVGPTGIYGAFQKYMRRSKATKNDTQFNKPGVLTLVYQVPWPFI